MLWFLDIAARAAWVADDYLDDAVGVMTANAVGKQWIGLVTLRPCIRFAGEKQPDTPEAMRAVVHALSTHFEADQRAPWAMADAPADYIETMLGAIVMIELPIAELVGKFKLSQNRSSTDRLGTEAGLADRAHSDLAADMQALREAP